VARLDQPPKPQPKNSTSATQIQKVNVTRAALYSFLSRAFKVEADQRFLDSVIAMEPTFRSLSDSQSGEESEELDQGSKGLLEFTKQVRELDDKQREKLLLDLAVEYASLFLGVGLKHVYLVESVYLGKEHLLYEAPFHEVLDAYRSLGFEKDKDYREPEDHVAVEFEFMARLCQWTSQTLEKKDLENTITYLNLQKEFLKDHISRWIPELCHKLDDATENPFYKTLAHLTLGFVTMENEIPDHMIGILKDAFSFEITKVKIDKDSSVTYYVKDN
jgi:TorA maturation chaperone TorD